ncbi:MAG: aspartate/glutamate racemase family protein [Pseudomonadota bacterium]
MAIVIINPNSTKAMTDAMVEVARGANPRYEFVGWTSAKGPPSIEGAADGALAAPPLLDLVQKASSEGAEGIMIGCFDDTGLQKAAEHAKCAVIGIGQASYHYAALRQWRFSVVTTLSVSVPVLEANIRGAGLANRLARVRASDVPVLDLERRPEASGRKILAEATISAAEDEVDAIILGCAGMVKVVEEVSDALDIAVIDPIVCAARCMAWLVPK